MSSDPSILPKDELVSLVREQENEIQDLRGKILHLQAEVKVFRDRRRCRQKSKRHE
jgi:hypothetical protein